MTLAERRERELAKMRINRKITKNDDNNSKDVEYKSEPLSRAQIAELEMKKIKNTKDEKLEDININSEIHGNTPSQYQEELNAMKNSILLARRCIHFFGLLGLFNTKSESFSFHGIDCKIKKYSTYTFHDQVIYNVLKIDIYKHTDGFIFNDILYEDGIFHGSSLNFDHQMKQYKADYQKLTRLYETIIQLKNDGFRFDEKLNFSEKSEGKSNFSLINRFKNIFR